MLTSSLIPETVLETILILAAGAATIAALGYLAAEQLRSPAWQRAVWQIVLLAVAGLTLAELAGLSSCAAHLIAIGHGSAQAPHTGPAPPSVEQAAPPVSRVGTSEPREVTSSLLASTGTMRSLPPARPGRADLPGGEAHLSRPSLGGPREITTPSVAPPGGSFPKTTAAEVHPAGASAVSLGPTADAGEAAGTVQAAGAAASTAASLLDAGHSAGVAWWRAALGPWVAIVWIGGVLVLAVLRAGVGSLLLLRFGRRLRPLSDDALSWSVYVVSRRLGMRRAVRLREASGLAAPMAWGLVRPTVALPPGFAEDYGPQEQQAMLAHELAHLRGADPLWQRLADWLTVVLWWHPAAWWMRRQWQAASERAADEASLVVDGGPELLAECLVQLGGRVSGARPLGWVGMRGGFRSHLGRRVERLLSLGHERWRPPGRLLWAKALIPAAAVAVAILGTSWARSETSYDGGADMKMVQHYWRQSVLGVALVATIGAADRARAVENPSADDAAVAAQDQDRPPAGGKDRPDGDRPKDGRREGDRPREGADRPPAGGGDRRDGDRPKGDRRDPDRRDGDRPAPREGDRRDGPRPKGERRDGDRPPGEGDQERQLQHLKAAADNLEAAGRHEEAERIRREIMERARRGGGGEPGRGPGRTDAGPRPGQSGPAGGQELMAVIRQLQEEVAQLRREMADMRRMLPGPRGGEPGPRKIEPGESRRNRPADARPEGGPDRRPGAEEPRRKFRPDFNPDDKRPREEGPRKDRQPPRDEGEEGSTELAPPPREGR